MRKFLLATVTVLVLSGTAYSQDLSGLKVGDSITSAEKIMGSTKNKHPSGPYMIEKWALEDGNDLSVTANRSTGQIVYMENDWGGKRAGAASDFPGMTYGQSSIGDMWKLTGNGGFEFENNVIQKIPNGAISFMGYQVKPNPGLIVMFVYKHPPLNDDHMDITKGRLDALIVANLDYLENIWGKDKHVSDDYKPIEWK